MRIMGRQKQTGFTVIEVVLVIAISGLIAMGIMSSSSRQVNVQNYRDGVESFRDFLAGQFEDLDSVKNNQSGGCPGGASHGRGAGNCFYSGKFISITASGDETKLEARPIQSTVNEVDDTIASVNVVGDDTDENVQKSRINWGVQAVSSLSPTSPINRYVTIFRSPITGSVSSYVTAENVSSNLLTLVTADPAAVPSYIADDAIMCLKDPTLPDTEDYRAGWMAVRIASDAVDASGVTTRAGQCS